MTETDSTSTWPGARWASDTLFTAAWAYDLAFAWDISRELDTLVRLARVGGRAGARLLTPACGTGRYALGLAQRGFTVDASDINPAMLAHARRHRAHPRLTYAQADMSRPIGIETRDCDAAFTLCNSFRYLLDESDALAHLGAVRRRLRPGAHYVLELALGWDEALVGGRNAWRVLYPELSVTASWTLESLSPPLSVELAEIVIEREGSPPQRFRERQPQRVWTREQLAEAADSAGMELCGVYDMSGRALARPGRLARAYVALRRPEEQDA